MRTSAIEGIFMRKRNIIVVLLATVLALTVVAPASAREHQEGGEAIFGLFPDEENGVAVFWNITRENFCEWEAGGFEGEPPVESLVPADIVETDDGALMGSYNATRPMELWTLDADVPPLISACEDTDDNGDPWATGSATVVGKDNDLLSDTVDLNIFGDKGRGTVYEADGTAWSYSWLFRIWIGDEVFEIEDSTVLVML
jgi:hypothetical protein